MYRTLCLISPSYYSSRPLYVYSLIIAKGYEDLLKIMLQIQQDCRKEERKSLLQEEVSPEVLFLQKIAGDEKPNEQEIFSSETKKLFEERSFCFIYSSLVGVARKKQQKVNFDEKVLYKTTENLITEFCSQKERES